MTEKINFLGSVDKLPPSHNKLLKQEVVSATICSIVVVCVYINIQYIFSEASWLGISHL